ncbi:MAG TPA: GNAT family protein [Thermomicrobiales bacterium]|nr:GNAT family protein [Thermomicrobiales bacterium]
MDPARLDRELGPELHWRPVAPPARAPLTGVHVSLLPLDADAHAASLYAAAQGDGADPDLWLYLPYGPFADEAAFTAWVRANSESTDPLFFAVVPAGGAPAGQATYMRCEPSIGVIEIGHIWFGAALQRTIAATEAIFLLARHVFDDLGYRRLEWKCNARNERSRRAAERFGFTYEGTFRNARVDRDRNRDTAWFSIIDSEWPVLRAAIEQWLDPLNVDASGRQIRSLRSIREDLQHAAQNAGA